MRLRSDGTLRLSPSDLSAHLACPHLTTLSWRCTRESERSRTSTTRTATSSAGRDDEHEAAYLARLGPRGTLDRPDPDVRRRGLRRRRGAPPDRGGRPRAGRGRHLPAVPRQQDGSWRGFADFLERTRRARTSRSTRSSPGRQSPRTCSSCSSTPSRSSGCRGLPVERVHVELGRGERESFRVAELRAYYRRVRERFLRVLERDDETYPWPCGHCGICDFRHVCRAKLEADDHLVLVAGMRRGWAETLEAGGVETLAQLAVAADGRQRRAARHAARDASRRCVTRRSSSSAVARRGASLRAPARRGGARVPTPARARLRRRVARPRGPSVLRAGARARVSSSGGATATRTARCATRHSGRATATASARCSSGSSTGSSSAAAAIPRLHVYHYAAYERTALTRLMGEHGTREREVDDFLRQEVLVDLYRVVQASRSAPRRRATRSRRSRRSTASCAGRGEGR